MATDRPFVPCPVAPIVPSGTVSAPVRTCIGCRRHVDRSDVLRVVAVAQESSTQLVLRPDPRGRLPGRGAWLHCATECFERAVRRRAFGRALRLDAGFDPAEVARYVAEHAQQTIGGLEQDRPNS